MNVFHYYIGGEDVIVSLEIGQAGPEEAPVYIVSIDDGVANCEVFEFGTLSNAFFFIASFERASEEGNTLNTWSICEEVLAMIEAR